MIVADRSCSGQTSMITVLTTAVIIRLPPGDGRKCSGGLDCLDGEDLLLTVCTRSMSLSPIVLEVRDQYKQGGSIDKVVLGQASPEPG